MRSSIRPSSGFELCDGAKEIPTRSGVFPCDSVGGGAVRAQESVVAAGKMMLARRAAAAHRD
jgi:hypothetical protein